MKIQTELQDTKCPLTYQEAWNKYKQYNEALSPIYLLNYQHIDWQPFTDEEYTQGIALFPGSENHSMIYTKPLANKFIKTMIVMEKGVIRYTEHYLEDYSNDISQSRGSLFLKFAAFTATNLKKMTGIVTITSAGDTIVDTSLLPDFNYLNQHTDPTIPRAVVKLYTNNWWSGPRT
jgi:hypothetical protein